MYLWGKNIKEKICHLTHILLTYFIYLQNSYDHLSEIMILEAHNNQQKPK